MIEKEVKILLSKSDYDKLCEIFPAERTIFQTNYYYSCTLEGVSLRVRECEGKRLLQVKAPVPGSESRKGLQVRREYETEINEIPDEISAETLKELTKLDFSDAKLTGSLFTERKLCLAYENAEICLDKSEYLGTVDYEIEVEYLGDHPEKIMKILAENGIFPQKSVEGKYGRFISRKKLLNMS